MISQKIVKKQKYKERKHGKYFRQLNQIIKKQKFLYFIRITKMGNNSATFMYQCGSRYEGQIVDGLPHGKAKIYISKISPAFNPSLDIQNQFAHIDCEFSQGQLIHIKFKTNNHFIYEGKLRSEKCQQTKGTLVDQHNVIYNGTFDENGKLINGMIQCYIEDQSNTIAYKCSTQNQFISTSIIDGFGKYFNISEQYLTEGKFYKGNLINGIYLHKNGDLIQGQFNQGCPHGDGIYRTSTYVHEYLKVDGNKLRENIQFRSILSNNRQKSVNTEFQYKGKFLKRLPHGKAQVFFLNGDTYKGKFKNGNMHGYGVYHFADGTVFDGNFYCGVLNGDCKISYTQASLINMGKQKHQILEKYQGQINEGAFHGLGTLYFANGLIFKGYFQQGFKNGNGVLIYCQNKYKCLYIMDRLIGDFSIFSD